MNNSILSTPTITTTTVAAPPSNPNVNNIQMGDVQKLQQQLQDIKEQVNILTLYCIDSCCGELEFKNFCEYFFNTVIRHNSNIPVFAIIIY